MTSEKPGKDLQPAIDGELRLLRPEVRQSPAALEALLDPDFFEFGASGRRWNRRETIAMLAAEDREPGVAHDVAAIRIAARVVLVTYTSQDEERRCHRSSLWRETAAGWQMVFHQATLIPAGTEH